jgi:hypothetical protein
MLIHTRGGVGGGAFAPRLDAVGVVRGKGVHVVSVVTHYQGLTPSTSQLNLSRFCH